MSGAMAENLKPVSFEELMGGAAAAPTPSALPDDNLTQVCVFTKDGLAEVAKLLKTIRTDKTLHKQEVEDLLDDPQYAKPLTGHTIDRGRIFKTKLELCEYFTSIFDNAFLESHRKDSGLWTWLALAYYPQFVKTKKDVTTLSADACWIFDPNIYRYGRRHYVAGALYLYRDVKEAGAAAIDMLFNRPVVEFGRMIDALTNVEDSIRTPVFFGAALKLYYDPAKAKRYRSAAIDQDGAGSVRQLTRVVQQLRETFDLSEVADIDRLYALLPMQFEKFKGEVEGNK